MSRVHVRVSHSRSLAAVSAPLGLNKFTVPSGAEVVSPFGGSGKGKGSMVGGCGLWTDSVVGGFERYA